MKTISIKELIKILKEEEKKGATQITYKGTILSNNGNTVILTTEKQF